MFFLNLSLGEFLTLLGALSGVITALYLLDRSKKKKVVSTLRFWVEAPRVDERSRRKRIREPWSFLLQLAGIVFLLLAIAQLQWGSRERPGRNHVLVLDTSSWTMQKSGNGILLDAVKRRARQYIAALPLHDRVMVIRADGLATPVVSFTDDRKLLSQAIEASAPSYSALSLGAALDSARRALRWSGGAKGEIVFVGTTRVVAAEDQATTVPNLRFLNIEADSENAGIRQVGLRRSPDARNLWAATIAIRNYGNQPQSLAVHLRFAATEFAARHLALSANEERNVEYKFSTSGAGTLTAWINHADSLAADNRVHLEMPTSAKLRLAVFSSRPSIWRTLFDADTNLAADYLQPAAYTAKPEADIVLLDGFNPSALPQVPSLWIAPPPDNSPVPVTGKVNDVVLNHWNAENSLDYGLHSRGMRLKSTEIFSAANGAIPVASVESGPVVIAAPAIANRPRLAVIGFDPGEPGLRYELSTPLLFANLVRWLEPDSYRISELTATPVGAVSIVLDPAEASQRIRVLDERGFAVPFTVRNGTLQLYAARPGTVRVITSDRERVLSLTLPDIAQYVWTPPAEAQRGLPGSPWNGASAIELWKWLAAFGGLLLFAEWYLFGRQRSFRRRTAPIWQTSSDRHERDLVNR
jgi:hypothetical protein